MNAGGLKEPDFEAIHALKPDLIIIAGRQASSYEEFKAIAPTIYMDIDTDRYMESFKENAENLGKIFNKESEVQAELAKIDGDIKQLNEKVTASNKMRSSFWRTTAKSAPMAPAPASALFMTCSASRR